VIGRHYTDDAERDFDRWDMEQAKREARLPVCDKCGERIHDDDYYDVEGDILCEDCMKEKYRRSTADYVEND
jgi:formylmethanofuran dehydrogenase subunit E